VLFNAQGAGLVAHLVLTTASILVLDRLNIAGSAP
jgi:hypothetical protein